MSREGAKTGVRVEFPRRGGAMRAVQSEKSDSDPGFPVLYGLANCDTCRKARNWLKRFHIEHRFVDYRAEPVDAPALCAWAGQVGGWNALVNKSSTTWRNLLPQRKHPGSDPEWTLLLHEYPALVRRPVVVMPDGAVSVGFSDNLFKNLFGEVKHDHV